MSLKPYFYYTLNSFCNRYNISSEYVQNQFRQRYALSPSTTINEKIVVLISELDLLDLLGYGPFDNTPDDDIRRQAMIQMNPTPW